jgi:hypothetical protein
MNEVKNLENMHSSFTVSKKERDPFQDFIKILNERYKELKIELIGKNKPLETPKKKKIILNFTKNKDARSFYHHEEIEVEINL